MLALLAVLVARAAAEPRDQPGDQPADDDREDDGGAADRERGELSSAGQQPRAAIFVPRDAPAASAVVAAAYRAAGLARDPTSSWRWRSRLGAFVPWLSVRTGQNQSWREVTDPTVNRGAVVDFRATWHLDRLLFDGNEPRIAMLDVARRRERHHVATRAIHLYFDWLALPSAEIAAELDAITDGWFSDALANTVKPR